MFLRCVVVFYLSWCSFGDAEDELIAVTALVRHGARLPESFYPNDPYKNVTWPYVLGDMINKGFSEMYNAGRWLKGRYSNFLSEKYDPNEIYAQSLDYDRCIMTGQATLEGLYPPFSNDIWNPNILWQPIPLHITPTWQDIVVDMSRCPKVTEIEALIRGKPEYYKIMTEYENYFNFLSENSGENINLSNMYPLFDTLFSEVKMDLPLPEWAQKAFPEMIPLIIRYTKMNSMTQTEKQIQTGPILTRILEQFSKAITRQDFGTTKTIFRKFMVYFGTEWLLYDLTYTLGFPSIHIPEFGAIYLLELRTNQFGKYYVNVLYRHSTDPKAKAVPVSVEKEDFNLNFERFERKIQPYLVNSTSWKRLCELFTGDIINVDVNVPMS